MTVRTRAQLEAEATLISEETTAGANTAQRVGGAILDLAQSAQLLGENEALGYNVQDFGALPSALAAVNDVAIQAAVTAAAAIGAHLYWPPGTYQTSVSIEGLHTVHHRGGAAIQRGSDVFYVEPGEGQTNRIYFDAAGSSLNDGLSASQPIDTLANAFAVAPNYGPMLGGTWRFIGAAGTLSPRNVSFAVPSKNLVYVQGPATGWTPGTDPATKVPTLIFDGAGCASGDFAARAHGKGVQVYWQDILVQNFDSASHNNVGLLADYGADFWTYNVQTSANTYSLYGEGCNIVRLTGGVHDAGKQTILLNACGHVTLGYQHTAATDMLIKNATYRGIEWSRGTNGHIDLISFADNVTDIAIFHNSRAHLYANNFKRATSSAVFSGTGGFYYLDATGGGNVFNEGTADAPAIKFLNFSGCGESDADLWLAQSDRRRGYDKNTHTHTGTTSKTTLSTPCTIPAYWFQDPTKKLLVRVWGELTTGAVASKIGVDLGATQVDQAAMPGTPGAGVKFYYECEVVSLAANSQFFQSRLDYSGNVAGPIIQSFSRTVTTSAALAVNVTGQLVGGGDTMKVEFVEVWVTG